MSDRVLKLAELVSAGMLEIGAGRPRSVGLDRFPLPILRVADVMEGRIQQLDQVDAPMIRSDEMGSKTSRPGDVVLTAKGTVGRVAIMPSVGPVYAYSPQLCYFRAAVDGLLNSRYLYYWFKSEEFWGQADALKGQTDMADFLSLSDVGSLKMRIPPLEEQEAAINVLGSIDDKIAVNQRIIDLSEKLAEVSLSAAFDGRFASLSSQAFVTMGSSPPGASYNKRAVGTPFYQGVRDFGARFPAKRVWTTAPVRMAGVRDTLVSVRAPVGRTNIANEEMCIGRGVASLRSRSGCPMTLFHQVRAARDAWAPFEAEGTVFGAVNKSQLEAVLVPMVRAEIVEELERKLAVIENRIAAALSENEILAKTRNELLPLLMSGKVRVREAEEIVEGVV
ncbi:restriction endonuclease subunit S [Lentzea sp. NPDC092896]|uniref:restriction endonuclease subunit S n=1 Tax=Lentzea sp. NPDC092896 TaxID=3364127 RepID=UPI0037FB76A0